MASVRAVEQGDAEGDLVDDTIASDTWQTLQTSDGLVERRTSPTSGVTALRLHGFKLTEWSFLDIHQNPSMGNLMSLTVDRCRCHKSLMLLAECLPPRIEHLVLIRCPLDSTAGYRVLAALSTLHHLNQLEITLCEFNDLNTIRLANNRLRHLHVKTNFVDNLDWLGLQPMTSNLTSLSLTDNNLGMHPLDRLIHVPQLQELDVSHNEICATGVQNLLKANLPLRRLNLECCWLGHIGSTHVAKLIQHTPTLEYLNVADNVLGDLGSIRIIQDGLRHSTSLQIIHLGANNMTDLGIMALAGVVMDHSSITGIGLVRNGRISNAAWSQLAHAVAHNPRIDMVDTFGNGLLSLENHGIALIRLYTDVMRTEKFSTLLEEEQTCVWPLLLSKISQQFGPVVAAQELIYQLLRRKPNLAM